MTGSGGLHHGDHPHPLPEDNSHAGHGAVVLDIGGDVGALVLHARGLPIGQEIELAPVDGSAAPVHVAVVTRPVPAGGVLPTAVFGSLIAGPYDVWLRPRDRDHAVALRVDVVGGAVTEADFPALLPTSSPVTLAAS